MAPSQRWKARAKLPVAVVPEKEAETARRQTKKVDIAQRVKPLPDLTPLQRAIECRTTTQAAEDMTREQFNFLAFWRSYMNDGMSPLESTKACLGLLDTAVTLDDIYDLTFILRNKGSVECAKTGRQLVSLCAELGHAEATIQVVGSALRQDATKPGIMASRTALKALDRLREVASTGNVRALVMEANVARHARQVNRAATLYQKALDLMATNDDVQPDDKYSKIKDELSSPWIELAYLYHTQGKNIEALKAYQAGTEKDDPMAYFNLARLDLFMAHNQHTHDWLYNITKAAASGYYKAAHELGEYYANSATNPSIPQQSFLEKLSGFSAFLYKQNVNLNPKANIAHHDAFASTPELRIKLAHQWLLTASKNYYLPADITLAELYLQKFIYPEGTLSKPLDPYGHSTDEDRIDNPLYSPDKAQVMLTQVLTGCLKIAEAKGISTTNAEYLHLARPWSLHAEVLEAVEGDEVLQQLKDSAEMIADAAGIDIYSSAELPDGIPHLGFLRYHKGTRGEGLKEKEEEE
ncbi:unnamed protein product [Aureobasidium uvarum]|uniref:Uncharacterized protein n=1 Tax=Aureobasidium uvarum TaxID=2773716 RepID=A0A9N8KI46_9PEZI|nr:unnamed protein product [Aureobasidium uvarum]